MITAVMLIIGAAFAAGSVPEKEDELFAHFEGMEWSFCSGAGAWSTDLQIRPDGTFTGQFHDSEMGESAEAYPDGTVYICEFSGRFSVVSREAVVLQLLTKELILTLYQQQPASYQVILKRDFFREPRPGTVRLFTLRAA